MGGGEIWEGWGDAVGPETSRQGKVMGETASWGSLEEREERSHHPLPPEDWKRRRLSLEGLKDVGAS